MTIESWRQIELRDGSVGSYTFYNGRIIVKSAHGTKTAQLRLGAHPKIVARQLLA
jgi:hypothetical protein